MSSSSGQNPSTVHEGGEPDYTDVISVILGRGAMSKAEMLSMWPLNNDQYAQVKERLSRGKLLEPDPKGAGGFGARLDKKPGQRAIFANINNNSPLTYIHCRTRKSESERSDRAMLSGRLYPEF